MLSLLLGVPSCIYSFWHGVIPTSYFIFILVYTRFLQKYIYTCKSIQWPMYVLVCVVLVSVLLLIVIVNLMKLAKYMLLFVTVM